jgi:sodium/potassium/calcium exchanger 6
MPSFSLVGALEFRQVVASLQHQAAGSSLNMFESPVTPYAGGHYGRRPRSRMPSGETDPWDAALGVPLNERSPPRLLVTPALSEEPEGGSRLRDYGSRPAIPAISHTPASPTMSDGDAESQQFMEPTRRQRIVHILGRTGHILCPSLHHFKSKSFLGKIASILAAPAVLVLTLTLPVMVTPYESSRAHEEKIQGSEGRLIDFEEEGIERALIAEEEVQEDLHEMKFNKWLMAAQCALGPLFCTGVLFGAFVYYAVTYLS